MDYREFFFKYRSYTPIPLLIIVLIFAQTNLYSFISGFVVLILGEFIRLESIRYAGSATRTTGKVGACELVTTGPYGYVRNPLYLGNFLISLGIIIMGWALMPWLLIIFLCLFFVQYFAIIQLEEEFLSEKFDKEYQIYKDNVPGYIPRLNAWHVGERKPTSFLHAIKTERRTLQSMSATVLLILLRWILG